MWNWRSRNDEQSDDLDSPEMQAEVQKLLRDLDGKRAEPSPFFAKRVMAAIHLREAELSRKARAWAAIPSFASRVSAIAALVLVVASTWLWTGHRQPVVTTVGLVEDFSGSASQTNQDDVFVAPSEETR